MLGTLGYAAPVRKKLAIKAGKVITIAGPDIQDGVILVEDGIIKAVDKNVEIPWDAEVIEAKDRVVMPGFVLRTPQTAWMHKMKTCPKCLFFRLLTQ